MPKVWRYIKILTIIALSLSYSNCAAAKSKEEAVDVVKSAVVRLEVRVLQEPTPKGSHLGTGFVVDAKRGLIVTNRHVVDGDSIAKIEVVFSNGSVSTAALVYADPLYDFSILKVIETNTIPKEVASLPLTSTMAKIGERVFMIGNNEGNFLAIQEGRISSSTVTDFLAPGQSYNISLNSKGGSSGSPVCMENGVVIGLLFGGQETAGTALNILHVKDALEAIISGQKPNRRDIGVGLEYYLLDDAAKYFNFPKDKIAEYAKKFPDARHRVLQVQRLYPGRLNGDKLQLGDIIWAVNGREIGPNLYQLDKIIDHVEAGKEINIQVYREGKLIDLKVGTYDLEKRDIAKMVYFGGATFFELNDWMSAVIGAPAGSVFIMNIEENSCFNLPITLWYAGQRLAGEYVIQVTRMGNCNITSLDDVVSCIPELVKQNYFALHFRNYGYQVEHGPQPVFNRGDSFINVAYDNYPKDPKLFVKQNNEWSAASLLSAPISTAASN